MDEPGPRCGRKSGAEGGGRWQEVRTVGTGWGAGQPGPSQRRARGVW